MTRKKCSSASHICCQHQAETPGLAVKNLGAGRGRWKLL